jgi:hypothetical protein
MLKDPENAQPTTEKAEKGSTGAKGKEAAIEETGATGETGEIEEKEEIGIVATAEKEQIGATVVNAITVANASRTDAKTKVRGTRVVEAESRGKSRRRRSRR